MSPMPGAEQMPPGAAGVWGVRATASCAVAACPPPAACWAATTCCTVEAGAPTAACAIAGDPSRAAPATAMITPGTVTTARTTLAVRRGTLAMVGS